MKHIVVVITLMLLAAELSAQSMFPYNEDSLRTVLRGKQDTTAVNILLQLAGSYFFKQPDSSLLYANAALDSSRRSNFEYSILKSLIHAGEATRMLGNFIEALKIQQEAFELSKRIGARNYEANSTGFMGIEYFELQHFEEAISYLKRAVAMRKSMRSDPIETLFTVYTGRAYIEMNEFDSAHHFLNMAATMTKTMNGPALKMLTIYSIGDYYFHTGQIDSAYFYCKAALKLAADNENVVPNHVSLAAAKLSSLFTLKNQLDSSMYFARHGFKIATARKLNPRILETSRQLADLHRKKGNDDSVLYYQDIAMAVNDSIFGSDKFNELGLLQLEEQKRILDIQQAEERYQNNIRFIGLISITAIILVGSLLLFRSNRIKQRTNRVLQQAMNELKATQSQLIQSEKMASLGELTAGIAHEIQNPLNFVNNFSELNRELIDELNINAKEGKIEAVQRLANDIKENEEKIEQHGKRADAIVKSMLQHSRASSGKKELIDINMLCDEYLRLTYHGYRAKDKSFNTTVNTILDPTIPKVNVIQQDIGRVLLNLINNAFYAVSEMKKLKGDGYEPNVSVETKNLSGKVEITVTDNGIGVSEKVKEKIFQPFFTTKPTGQGTGLGLSLSYDIIKAHGGTIVVNSPAAGRAGNGGQGSEFIVELPI